MLILPKSSLVSWSNSDSTTSRPQILPLSSAIKKENNSCMCLCGVKWIKAGACKRWSNPASCQLLLAVKKQREKQLSCTATYTQSFTQTCLISFITVSVKIMLSYITGKAPKSFHIIGDYFSLI